MLSSARRFLSHLRLGGLLGPALLITGALSTNNPSAFLDDMSNILTRDLGRADLSVRMPAARWTGPRHMLAKDIPQTTPPAAAPMLEAPNPASVIVVDSVSRQPVPVRGNTGMDSLPQVLVQKPARPRTPVMTPQNGTTLALQHRGSADNALVPK